MPSLEDRKKKIRVVIDSTEIISPLHELMISRSTRDGDPDTEMSGFLFNYVEHKRPGKPLVKCSVGSIDMTGHPESIEIKFQESLSAAEMDDYDKMAGDIAFAKKAISSARNMTGRSKVVIVLNGPWDRYPTSLASINPSNSSAIIVDYDETEKRSAIVISVDNSHSTETKWIIISSFIELIEKTRSSRESSLYELESEGSINERSWI